MTAEFREDYGGGIPYFSYVFDTFTDARYTQFVFSIKRSNVDTLGIFLGYCPRNENCQPVLIGISEGFLLGDDDEEVW